MPGSPTELVMALRGLAVVTKQVVHGEPGDWRLTGEGGMRAVDVVDVQPARQRAARSCDDRKAWA